jgi:transposase-like protein
MHVNLTDKRYYSIGEVAKAFNVKPSLLRFWEKEFKEIQPKKNRVEPESTLQKTF